MTTRRQKPVIPLKLERTSFVDGVWHGELSALGPVPDVPELDVTLNGKPRPKPEMTAIAGRNTAWEIRFAVPTEALSDGVNQFAISDAASGNVLTHFSLVAQEAVADELRAEIAVLREELAQLRQAFQAEMRARPLTGTD